MKLFPSASENAPELVMASLRAYVRARISDRSRFTVPAGDLSGDYGLTYLVSRGRYRRTHRTEEGEGTGRCNGIGKSPKKNELPRMRAATSREIALRRAALRAFRLPCESRRSRPRADLASPGVRFIFLDGNGRKCLPRISPPFEMSRRARAFGEKRETDRSRDRSRDRDESRGGARWLFHSRRELIELAAVAGSGSRAR